MPHDKNGKTVGVGDIVIMQFRVEKVTTVFDGTCNVDLATIDSPELYPDRITTFAKKVILTRKNRVPEIPKPPAPEKEAALKEEVANILKPDADGVSAEIKAAE